MGPMKTCFLNQERDCTAACAAFQELPFSGRGTNCRLLNFLDRLTPPPPSRPTVPVAPPKGKT